MALDSGSRLGPYEISALIGVGGMGEVYRARDTKLGRDVAIKLLPAELSRDQDRLARFRREAQILASLNHPNIGAIYDLKAESDQQFLVLELVEGETLADRLRRGALQLREALEIGKQIASALEAAHQKGVLHRDLKPSNVQLTAEGVAKALDFGLAKVITSEVTGSSAATMVSPAQTRVGLIMGTAAYMSPEQARGHELDERTDLWAFGCVLYECLTGKLAFAGDDVTETLAAVLKSDPDWSSLPSGTPAVIRSLLRQCLAKPRNQRLRDARAARLMIEDTLAAPAELPPASAETPVERRPARVAIAAAIVAAVLSGAAVWAVKAFAPSATSATASAPVVRARIDVAEGQRLSSILALDELPISLQRPSRPAIAFSPDGTRLAYTAGDGKVTHLYVRRLDQTRAAVIAGTEGAALPFFSPDGASVGFFVGTEMKRVAVDGGEVRTISASPRELLVPGPAVWTEDDRLLIANDKIYEMPASGGQLTPLTQLEGDEILHAYPHLLPGRRGLLYNVLTRSHATVPSDWAIVVQPLDGGERRVLIDRGSDPVYLPTGHLVFARHGALLAAPFDATSLKLTGAPTVVIENIMQAEGGGNGSLNSGTAQFTVSRTGSLAYVPGGIYPDTGLVRLVWVDLEGKATDLGLPTASYLFPRVSPDGKRLSYCVGRFGDRQVWVYDLTLGIATALTKSGEHQGVNWSPDGTRLTFFRPDLDNRMFTVPVDGGAEPQPIGEGLRGYPLSWSRDDVLAFLPLDSSGLSTVRLDGVSKPEPFADGQTFFATFSPDGKWLAYALIEAGRPEVYVSPYPGRIPKYRISPAGGFFPVWSPDGKQLFFQESLDAGGRTWKQMVVDVTTAPAFTQSRPRELFTGDYGPTFPERSTDIAPDGRRFIMIVGADMPANEPVTSIQLVLNWFSELNRLVPLPSQR